MILGGLQPKVANRLPNDANRVLLDPMAIPLAKRPDVPAALVSAVVAALGAAGVMTAWGLTADDVATLLGILMAIAATVRELVARKSAGANS